MPTKSKYYSADEYDSASDIENAETLISRNRAPRHEKKKSKPDQSKKKVIKAQRTKRPVTPNSGRHSYRHRSNSAPPTRSAREIWLSAVKSRQTVGLYTSRKPESPRHKTPTEYFVDTLRKTGCGISTESTNNSMSGLRRMGDKEMAYLSTSNFLRQKTGREKPTKNKYDNPTTKPPSGTPAYKSPEEYYDQILELKKQIQGLHQDNAALKAKVRRTEEDNIKKEKEIGGLLDPTKSEELRRTLGDKRSDSGSVIHSLKQKILKLETQLKDKETSYSKLQSDLKASKIEEMKVQLETCFQEIVRLQMSKDTGVHKSNRPTKDTTGKVKALNETVIRLSKQNEQLQSEIQSLRKDLHRELDDKGRDTSREYEDMNRKQLLGAIKKLEKKLQIADKKSGDTDSIQSYNERMDERQGKHKIPLEGSTEERLESLDKRETQLLDELQKQKDLVKRLQEDKASYRKKCEEKEKEIQALHKELNDLQSQLNVPLTGRRTPRSTTPRRPSSRPPSGRRSSVDSTASEDRRRKEVEKFREDYAAKKIQQKYKSFRKARDEHEEAEVQKKINDFRANKAASKIQSRWKKHQESVKDREENERKVQQFKKERSARVIQKHWNNYQYKKHDEEVGDAASLIQSAYRGHCTRKSHLKTYVSDDEDDDDEDDEDYLETVDFIRNTVKGHVARKQKLKSYNFDSTEDDDDEDFVSSRYKTSVKRPSSGGKTSSSSYGGRPSSGSGRKTFSTSYGSRPGSAGRPSSSGSMRPGSARSRTSSGGKKSPLGSRRGDDDDDDDIQF